MCLWKPEVYPLLHEEWKLFHFVFIPLPSALLSLAQLITKDIWLLSQAVDRVDRSGFLLQVFVLSDQLSRWQRPHFPFSLSEACFPSRYLPIRTHYPLGTAALGVRRLWLQGWVSCGSNCRTSLLLLYCSHKESRGLAQLNPAGVFLPQFLSPKRPKPRLFRRHGRNTVVNRCGIISLLLLHLGLFSNLWHLNKSLNHQGCLSCPKVWVFF